MLHLWEQGQLLRDYSKAKEKKLVPANLNVVNAGDVACYNLVQGMISIKGISTILLFDSRCTHSFISYSMVKNVNLKPRILDLLWSLVHKMGGKHKLHVCKFNHNECTREVKVWDLLMYHLVGIDIIQGMDWLSWPCHHILQKIECISFLRDWQWRK